MWFDDQVLIPRILRSFLCSIVIQECYISLLLLLLKCISWNPATGILDWMFYLIHWKAIFYRCVLCATTIAFGALNKNFYSAEKHICSTRFERIRRVLSPLRVQHFVVTAVLGGIISHCCLCLFSILDPEKSSVLSFLCVDSEFEHYFVVKHGCYSGIMFSLKYFICFLYLVKFNMSQETKLQHIKRQSLDLLKDSILCVVRSVHWYYLFFVLSGPVVENIFLSFGFKFSSDEGYLSLVYSLMNVKLFMVSLVTGTIIFFNWSLYLTIFNAFAAERHTFPIEIPIKNDKSKRLEIMLQNSESQILKYLAVLDFRFLAQHDPDRRKQLFSISHPGGHPHHWNALSEFCISSLKQLVHNLKEYSITTAAKETNPFLIEGNLALNKSRFFQPEDRKKQFTVSEKVFHQLRTWPIVAYFLDELPTIKIKKIFAASQPLIWIIEVLGYVVSFAYTEDKFGVTQKSLPDIILLLLDIKMAEEKLPVDLVGIRTYVKDPQGRYEHIHQRVALKSAVNSALCRIADTFKDDINGIYLPDEYSRYFHRYLSRRNT